MRKNMIVDFVNIRHISVKMNYYDFDVYMFKKSCAPKSSKVYKVGTLLILAIYLCKQNHTESIKYSALRIEFNISYFPKGIHHYYLRPSEG